MNDGEIELKNQDIIRSLYQERYLKEKLSCPSYENNAFHILKSFDEEPEEPEFFYKEICPVYDS